MSVHFSGDEKQLAEIFTRGLTDNIRARIKQTLMQHCEKLVDEALESLLKDLVTKAHLQFDHRQEAPVIQVSINGLKKDLP